MGKLLEALKAQGVEITEDVEKAVMADFVEKKDADLKDVEIADLKEQIVKRDADIEKLKEADPEVKKQLEELQEKYNQDTKDLSDKLADAKLTGELKLALSQTGTRDVELLAGLIDKAKLKLSEDGKLDGLTEQLDKIKTEKAFLFNAEDPTKKGNEFQYKPGAADSKATENVSFNDAVAEAMGVN